VTGDRWDRFERKQQQKSRLIEFLHRSRVTPVVARDDRPTLAEWLRRPEVRIGSLHEEIRNGLGECPELGVLQTVETELKYAGYIAQQQRQFDHMRASEHRRIPMEFCYSDIPGLSLEVQEKLTRVRPDTLGQAGRIPGVTPAAVAVLDVYLSIGR